ncbi:MAG: thioredoxin family protein [bacterium]|nr:thioredoxin family protein [bacterium]
MRKIQILGTGCLRCQQLAENAERAVREVGVPYEIEKVTDLDEITKFGLIATPALIVNGHIAAAGDVLSVEDIQEILSKGGA